MKIAFMTNDETGPRGCNHVESLVANLVATGCDICAIGQGYMINEPRDIEGRRSVQTILVNFGPRDHLTKEISAHLRALGRFVDID